MLWEPNKNIANKIINDIKSSDNLIKKNNNQESSTMDDETGGYKVDEPLSDTSPKRSLKRTYSEFNKLSIEEIDYQGSDIFKDNETSYYFVDDEPTSNSNHSDIQLNNSLKISEILEGNNDSMEF